MQWSLSLHPTLYSPKMRENANPVLSFLSSSFFPFLLYFWSPVGSKRLDWFLRSMVQSTWLGVMKYLLNEQIISHEFQRLQVYPIKNYPNHPNMLITQPNSRLQTIDKVQDGKDRHLRWRKSTIGLLSNCFADYLMLKLMFSVLLKKLLYYLSKTEEEIA